MDSTLGQHTPRVRTMSYRNHFDSKAPETPHNRFDSVMCNATQLSEKPLCAAVRALRMETGAYRFAIVNGIKRADRTYITYDDMDKINENAEQ